MRRVSLAFAVLIAFIAGFACARSLPTVHAADAPLVPQIIDLNTLSDADLGDPRPGTEIRSHTYVNMTGATVAVQTGNVAKHYHADANEVQYILEGSGTFTLGDTVRTIKPGDLIIILKGTPHAGSHAMTGRFKLLAIKTPPQAPDDVHPVP